MRVSRLRLGLAAWFGAAFLLGLVVLDAGILLYAHRKAGAKLAREVETEARDLSRAIMEEASAHPGTPDDAVVAEVLGEWPPGPDGVVVYDAAGRNIGERGDSGITERLAARRLGDSAGGQDLPVPGHADLRMAWLRSTAPRAVVVITANSTARLEQEQRALLGWLLLSLPLVAAGAAIAGYVLTRRALTPVLAMAQALDAIDPKRIDRRLPVGASPDELDQLASHFNGLLDRLAESREAGRRFLAQAAHQLRTPLTIVRGESALGLNRPRTTEDYLASLRRINLAAEQMSRRVGELFLLAEAEAGERPDVSARVELDGIVMEAADLMRGRATSLGRHLEFGPMEDVTVQGSEALLREAVMELLENACRHGGDERPVRISVRKDGTRTRILVANTGPTIPADTGSGLGLSIVRWVAEVHGGSMAIEWRDPLNVVVLDLPLAGAEPS